MKSSLELLGKTGIKLIGECLRQQQIGKRFVSDRTTEKWLSRKMEGTIGRIFTGFFRKSEPPAIDVVRWLLERRI
jgi:hypothetical protein